MPIQITMPRLSDTMQAGTVVRWNVKEGQKVKSGDVIADIETDKATMELQSFDDGTVASLAVREGQNVPVGTVIAVLAGSGEDVGKAKAAAGSAPPPATNQKSAPAKEAAPAKAPKPAAPAPAPAAQPSKPAPVHAGNGVAAMTPQGGQDRVFASPLARKIAAESRINLSTLRGSGPSGRIVRKDVEAAVSSGAGGGGKPSFSAGTLTHKVVPLSNMRRVIAQRLVESKTTIPHYQVSVQAEMSALLALRQQVNDLLASQGVKLSVNDFVVRACALAMNQHPYVNSRWVTTDEGEAIELLADVNVGVAIALSEEKGGGLLVATLRGADRLGVREISAQTKQLAEKARGKGLSPQEMSDSTFTISNLGMYGVDHFTAIINPPNAAILAVGGAIERPIVKDGQIVVGHVMTMTMSSDHRIIDGAMAARYLGSVRELLEKPAALLL